MYAPLVIVCGIDEAGRGPLAGPVTAAAVILPETFSTEGLADSKVLAPELRTASSDRIRAGSVTWGLGWVWPEEIDQLNIHHASLLAMRRAFFAMIGPYPPDEAATADADIKLERGSNSLADSTIIESRFGVTAARRGGPIPDRLPDLVRVDGRHAPQLPVPCEAIVKGDATHSEIQAASIVAKVARDGWMTEYAPLEPVYLFEKHKGYPTPEHRRLLREHGPSRIHRFSFRGI